jgi:hypothetical protein
MGQVRSAVGFFGGDFEAESNRGRGGGWLCYAMLCYAMQCDPTPRWREEERGERGVLWAATSGCKYHLHGTTSERDKSNTGRTIAQYLGRDGLMRRNASCMFSWVRVPAVFLCCSFLSSPVCTSVPPCWASHCWSSAPLLSGPSPFRFSHLGVTSISPLKATIASRHCRLSRSNEMVWSGLLLVLSCHLLACRANASRQIAPHLDRCWSRPTSEFVPSDGSFFPHAERVPSHAPPRTGHRVIMYDDGMRRVSTSCENGRDESDAACPRHPISLQVGLRDLQRRLHRFLIRAQTEMEQS